jgi:hypothetical protein
MGLGEPEPVDAEETAPVAVEAVSEPAEEAEPEPAEAAEAEPAAEEAEPEPVEAAEEAEPAAEEAEPALAEFDADRYTTAIEEPDWFEAEAEDEPRRAPYAEPEPEPEPEAEAEPGPVDAARPEPAPESGPEAELVEAAAPEPEPEPTFGEEALAPDEPTEADEPSTTPDEETMLWFGRQPPDASGADEMEVAGSGGALPEATDPLAPKPLPGSEELDEAMVALEDLTRRTEVRAPAEHDEWPPPSVGLVEPAGGSPTSEPRTGPVTRLPYASGGRPGSPATRAYRRLRRIFPG